MIYPSNWFREGILNQFRGTAFTLPSSLWLAWHTADPGIDGLTGEVSTVGTAYARTEIVLNTTNWSAPSGSGALESITNLVTITSPAPVGANWGLLSHWSLWTAVTGGNPVIIGDVPTPRQVNAGDVAPFLPPSQITISFGTVTP